MKLKTIEQRLIECRGFGPGFNTVRIALAMSVFLWHSFWIVYGVHYQDFYIGPLWAPLYGILPMFFALSGFLVTASALRLPLREYVLNRAFRIVPALAVDIGLSAVILGPLMTTFALSAYFSDPMFWTYFENIVGNIHFLLPGVFHENPYPDVVNASLWTVPYEIACYVVMSGLIGLGLITRRAWIVAALCATWLLGSALFHATGFATGFWLVDKAIHFLSQGGGVAMVPFFLAGSALYVARAYVPYDGRIALAAAAIVLIVGIVGSGAWEGPYLDAGLCLPLTYIVVWAGLSDLPDLPFFSRGDYSYGIYLYHFPLVQALVSVFHFQSLLALDVVAVPVVILFAIFSWHFIERPALQQRKRFSVVGARIAKDAI